MRSHQDRAAQGGPCSQLDDMTSQKANEVLNIGSVLGQRRILVQHERYRLRRGNHVIALWRRHHGDGLSLLAPAHELAVASARVQRKVHVTTPVRIKPK